MDEQLEPEQIPREEAVSKTPSRFAYGLSLGVGIGAIVMAVIAGGAYFGTAYYMSQRFSGGPPRSAAGSVKTVDAGSWFGVDSAGHGTVVGYSNGGGSGDGMPSGTLGYTEVTSAGSYSGVMVTHTVRLYISKDTRITIAGKPWTPQRSSSKSAAELLFAEDQADSPLDSRELTVRFKKVNDRLVAESIDGSSQQLDGPPPWEMD